MPTAAVWLLATRSVRSIIFFVCARGGVTIRVYPSETRLFSSACSGRPCGWLIAEGHEAWDMRWCPDVVHLKPLPAFQVCPLLQMFPGKELLLPSFDTKRNPCLYATCERLARRANPPWYPSMKGLGEKYIQRCHPDAPFTAWLGSNVRWGKRSTGAQATHQTALERVAD